METGEREKRWKKGWYEYGFKKGENGDEEREGGKRRGNGEGRIERYE